MASAYWLGIEKKIREDKEIEHEESMFEKRKAAQLEQLELQRKWKQEDFWTELEENRRTSMMEKGYGLLTRSIGSSVQTTKGGKTSSEAAEAQTWLEAMASQVEGGETLAIAGQVNPNLAVELETLYRDQAEEFQKVNLQLTPEIFFKGVELLGEVSVEVDDYSGLKTILDEIKTANLRDWDQIGDLNYRLAQEEAKSDKKSGLTFNYTPPTKGAPELWKDQFEYLSNLVLSRLKTDFDEAIAQGNKTEAAKRRIEIDNFESDVSQGDEMWQIFDRYMPSILPKLDTSTGPFFGLEDNLIIKNRIPDWLTVKEEDDPEDPIDPKVEEPVDPKVTPKVTQEVEEPVVKEEKESRGDRRKRREEIGQEPEVTKDEAERKPLTVEEIQQQNRRENIPLRFKDRIQAGKTVTAVEQVKELLRKEILLPGDTVEINGVWKTLK